MVTHPVTGLPSKKGWLPTVKEVHDACAEAVAPMKQREAREERIAEAMAARQEQDSRPRASTYAELKEKYGENWGMEPLIKPKSNFRAPNIEQLKAHYKARPGRVEWLSNRGPVLRGEVEDTPEPK